MCTPLLFPCSLYKTIYQTPAPETSKTKQWITTAKKILY